MRKLEVPVILGQDTNEVIAETAAEGSRQTRSYDGHSGKHSRYRPMDSN
jgi:hypothetical protein